MIPVNRGIYLSEYKTSGLQIETGLVLEDVLKTDQQFSNKHQTTASKSSLHIMNQNTIPSCFAELSGDVINYKVLVLGNSLREAVRKWYHVA